MTALLGLSHTIGSTLELRPLVAVILEQLRMIVPYLGASVLQFRGDEMAIIDWQQPDQVVTAPRQPPPFSLLNAPTLVDFIERREAMVIPDVHADSPLAREFQSTVGEDLLSTLFKPVKSWIGVPLVAQDRAIGLLTMSSADPDFFTADRVRAASLVANQAAVALENAHLYEEADTRTRELTALLEVSGAVASTLELRPLASVVLDQLKHVIDNTGSSLLLVEDQSLTIIEDRAVEGADDIIGFSIPLSRATALWDQLRSQRPIVIDDVRSNEPMARAYREVLGERFELPAFKHVCSWMAVPLAVQDRVIGMMSMSRGESSYFTDRHVRLARAIADQAAVAIENARLYQQAQQLAAVEERQRLARELHDSVSQALYGVALGARTARTLLDRDPAKATEPVEYVLSLAEAGLAEMRALIFELRPESLELEGLVAGLEKQSSALRARHNIEVNAELCPEPDAPLPVKEAISRIAQEAMHNTVKHARATQVTLRLRQHNGALELEVEDDGRGFDPTQPYAGHLGLRSMRERAAKLGGEISMESAPGDGARIRVSIPLNGSGA
jgi:signal transduction histidine kinase